jgi:hypothetical protein
MSEYPRIVGQQVDSKTCVLIQIGPEVGRVLDGNALRPEARLSSLLKFDVYVEFTGNTSAVLARYRRLAATSEVQPPRTSKALPPGPIYPRIVGQAVDGMAKVAVAVSTDRGYAMEMGALSLEKSLTEVLSSEVWEPFTGDEASVLRQFKMLLDRRTREEQTKARVPYGRVRPVVPVLPLGSQAGRGGRA